MNPVSFAAVGECMVELSGRGEELWRMGFAGDTFNAAYYARAILPPDRRVAYVTATGDDPFSVKLTAFIGASGIDTDRIRTIPGKRPGLYAITLEGAERHFTYWRGESAARQLADDPDWLGQALGGAELIYFSGITLGILDFAARARLMAELARRRHAGARIAFDPNFRPALWPDLDEARLAMEQAYQTSDVALPTFDDERKLFGDDRPETTAERLTQSGVKEVVVKNGGDACLIVTAGARLTVEPTPPEHIVDTTGAGDSFSGAYLAAFLMGYQPEPAARLGHAVAAQVIGVRGALTPVDLAKAFVGLDPLPSGIRR